MSGNSIILWKISTIIYPYSLFAFNRRCNSLTESETGLIVPSCVVPRCFCSALIVPWPNKPSCPIPKNLCNAFTTFEPVSDESNCAA
ncbi:hypothetical protein BK5-Tp29 [Lactococcus phage BK5-T]|uniref:Uncharacterized protein n=1 Tax=Lactococcus phage BK5-T TaxID=31754 RepID=Q94M96_9CAUD|nr:hypothetical protein BK5-Tp29 [Lactococcus phage BK5-T]YP_010133249.1 hypothetical protein K3164_gp29 [Lactococcus phage BK5-T]AAK56823.1 unknown [Lactococcus phage BK5-T]CAC80170.1 hypothetical protein [Lactococcus phage BK5-T]